MSRKFLTPLVLPADPTAALEAVTKQYVDARAGSEVEVAAADPIGTNPSAELWYDTDEPTPANPLASQISFAPPGAPLTATNVQAAINQLPRGLIASTFNANAVACPVNTITYLTTAIPFTSLVGRMYRLSWSFRAVGRTDNSATPVTTNLLAYDGTTNLNSWIDHWHLFSLNWSNLTGHAFVRGDGVARSLRVGVGSVAAPASPLTIYPTAFLIEDIGVG